VASPGNARSSEKCEQIVREEQDRAGAQEILMPTIQSAELWRESGRYDAWDLRCCAFDRHDREMLYSPTAEELMTDIARKHIQSYRDLPRMMYQIQ
jgi:prolyl-tRNA synthetase